MALMPTIACLRGSMPLKAKHSRPHGRSGVWLALVLRQKHQLQACNLWPGESRTRLVDACAGHCCPTWLQQAPAPAHGLAYLPATALAVRVIGSKSVTVM